jgi:hypothetical protein
MSTQITPHLLKVLRPEIDAALAALGKKYGIQFMARNARYTDTNATFKLELNTVNDGGAVVTREQADLASLGELYGIPSEYHKDKFNIQGEFYRLYGLKTKARSKPWLIKRLRDGKVFVCATTLVKAALGLNINVGRN